MAQVSLMSFGCFVLVNDKEVLDSTRAFVALSLFNILRFPLSMLPNVISNLVQVSWCFGTFAIGIVFTMAGEISLKMRIFYCSFHRSKSLCSSTLCPYSIYCP